MSHVVSIVVSLVMLVAVFFVPVYFVHSALGSDAVHVKVRRPVIIAGKKIAPVSLSLQRNI